MTDSGPINKSEHESDDVYVELEGLPAIIGFIEGRIAITFVDQTINPNNIPVVFINPEVKVQSIKILLEFTQEGFNFYQGGSNNMSLKEHIVVKTDINEPRMNSTGPPFT